MARPTHYPYSFKALLDVPRRVFNPPPAKVKVGRVRSMSLTPLFEVKLSDVLDGHHLPPLSRKDFEEYLLYVEHSPENLYFLQWLRDYSRGHTEWAQSGTPYSTRLALSWSRAKETFFTPGAHLRLNLPSSLLEGLVIPADDTSDRPTSAFHSPAYDGPSHPSHPPPPAFAKIQREVEDMLRESLVRFVSGSCGNSGRARGLFGIALGVITLAVGLAPVLVSILSGRGGRAVRIAAIPVFWLGAWVTIMSLHGVCILIFLFGDARQLYPYELARPKITSPILKPQGVTICSPDDRSEKSQPTNTAQLYVDLERGNRVSSYSSTSTFDHKQHAASSGAPGPARGESCELTVMSSPQTPSGFPGSPTSAQHLIRPQNMQGVGGSTPPASTHRWSFDFDALPTATPSPAAASGLEHWDAGSQGRPSEKEIPTFGPLTRVLSPIVTRAQWEVVVRSAMMAVVVALVLGGVCLAIPERR